MRLGSVKTVALSRFQLTRNAINDFDLSRRKKTGRSSSREEYRAIIAHERCILRCNFGSSCCHSSGNLGEAAFFFFLIRIIPARIIFIRALYLRRVVR